MSDITFMKGYGFPRGSAMDYAGYAGNPDPSAGDLNYGPVRFEGVTQSRMRIRSMPDPSNFGGLPDRLARLEPLALSQLGLLVLLATPVMRVASSVIGFALEGDRLYTALTVVVLAVLLGSIFFVR